MTEEPVLDLEQVMDEQELDRVRADALSKCRKLCEEEAQASNSKQYNSHFNKQLVPSLSTRDNKHSLRIYLNDANFGELGSRLEVRP